MATISFSIADLFFKEFGIKPTNFNFSQYPPEAPHPKDGNSLSSFAAKGGSPLYAKGGMGQYYFMPVRMGSGVNSMIDLPYPVVRCDWGKTIVDTPLTERNGTVKELINIQNYNISIRGLIIGDKKQWPEDQIAQLHDLFLAQESLILQCALTDIFLITPIRGGSDKVIIKSVKLGESKGAIDVVPYEIALVSDEIFNLETIDPKPSKQ